MKPNKTPGPSGQRRNGIEKKPLFIQRLQTAVTGDEEEQRRSGTITETESSADETQAGPGAEQLLVRIPGGSLRRPSTHSSAEE